VSKGSLCLIIGFGLTGLCHAANFDPFEGPEPLLVVVEFDPWSMVLGADSPRLAIYENGDAIFIGKDEKDSGYRFKRLTARELGSIRQEAAKALRNPELKHHYVMRGATDQPVA
jgi:hypothetical protein